MPRNVSSLGCYAAHCVAEGSAAAVPRKTIAAERMRTNADRGRRDGGHEKKVERGLNYDSDEK